MNNTNLTGRKDKKNAIIVALVALVAFMSVGYAVLATVLQINGTASIETDWDVEIVNITATENENGKNDEAVMAHTISTATFGAKLYQPGDSVVYTITVENKGTIDARLVNYTFTPAAVQTTEGATDGSEWITYEKVDDTEHVADATNGEILGAGETATFKVKVSYPAGSNLPSDILVKTRTVEATIEYQQAN